MSIRRSSSLVALAAVTAMPIARAATYVVTRHDDPAVIACTPRDCSLRSAVIAANANPGPDVIQLSKGEYDLALAPFHLIPGGALHVQDDLAVQGLGARSTTIRQHAHYRVFDAWSTRLDIVGVALLDGEVPEAQAADGGGCLYAENADVTLTDDVLANCSAGYIGGAVHMRGGHLVLDGTSIERNRAAIGGGIAMDGSDPRLALRNHARLHANAADWGGALDARAGVADAHGEIAHGAIVVMDAGSLVDANHATYGGGAVFVESGKGLGVSLDEDDVDTPGAFARFVSNESLPVEVGGNGGAFLGEGALVLARVRLEANRAIRGGALNMRRSLPTPFCPTTAVFDSLLLGNTAVVDGGAIWGGQGALYVDRTAFDDNHATYLGGAIYYASGDLHALGACDVAGVSLANASVHANGANHGAGIAIGNGAGVHGYARLDVHYASFLANHSTSFDGAADVYVENERVADGRGGFARSENGATTRASVYTGGCAYGTPSALATLGANVDTSAYTCTGSGDRAGVDPTALDLAYGYYGGLFALAGIVSPASVLIDAADGDCPATDARGAVRAATVCDSGAFEWNAPIP